MIFELSGWLVDGKEIYDVNACHGVSGVGKVNEIAGERPPTYLLEEQAWMTSMKWSKM